MLSEAFLNQLGKRNCERVNKWKLIGNEEDYSIDLIDANCGDFIPI